MPTPAIVGPGERPPSVTRLPDAGNIRSAGQLDFYVGDRLKKRRLEVGMTQTELANHLGLTFQQVQKYEWATNRVAASRLYEIATILGTDLAYFFEGWQQVAGLPAPPQGPVARDLAKESAGHGHENDLAEAEGREAAAAFLAIQDGEMRKRLLSLIKSMRYR